MMEEQMQPERGYYEQGDIWEAARYMADFEQARLAACRRAIPKDARTHLDVGAGNGVFLQGIEDEGLAGSRFGIERATTAARAAICKAPLLVGDAAHLPFADRSIDLVSALDVVEHFPYGLYEKAMGEIGRVSARYILLNVPYREHRLHAVCPYCNCRFDPHFHMRRFEDSSFAALFPGFDVVTVERVNRAESVLEAALRPFRHTVFGGFPPYGVCPQCNYRQQSQAGSGGAGSLAVARDIVRRVVRAFPKVGVPAEIVVLYRRSAENP